MDLGDTCTTCEPKEKTTCTLEMVNDMVMYYSKNTFSQEKIETEKRNGIEGADISIWAKQNGHM